MVLEIQASNFGSGKSMIAVHFDAATNAVFDFEKQWQPLKFGGPNSPLFVVCWVPRRETPD
jgi:hypothetical protein